MTNFPFITSNYYHIYNRGVEKRNTFTNKWDYSQFLLTLDFYRKTPLPTKLSDFKRGLESIKKITDQKELVEIFCYCLMPNHFHLLLKQCRDGGITKFLKDFSNSYTRYFNTKYDRVGPLFQGTSKSKLVKNDQYLLQLSKYIHRNPLKLGFKPLSSYPYSSYNYYLSKQKHPFCNIEFISSYFSQTNSKLNYKSFVEETDIENPAIYKLLIDPEED